MVTIQSKHKQKNIVVGINIGHDGGTAIIIDGKIKCAVSEEKLNRQKYSPGYLNSFFYCLHALNIKIDDVSLFVFSSYGDKLPYGYQGLLKYLNISFEKFISVDHHLSHAFGTYFLSPFNDALVVVMDGQGNDNNTESYYIAEGQKLEKIGENSLNRNPAKGIGRTYEAFTNFLGWTDKEAGKIMGLSAYGNASNIKIPLFELKNTEVIGALDYKYEKGVVDFLKRNNLDLGPIYSKGLNPKSYIAANYIQKETERIIIELIQKLVKTTGKRNLCLAGGVALNCNVNYRILKEKIVDDIFILPASSDKGQAIGNALFGFYINGYIPKNPLKNDYFGRNYIEEDIINVLKKKNNTFVKKCIPSKEIVFDKQISITKTVASLLAQNKIIGWFQGGSELGPRALGHRSIFCNPKDKEIKNILNTKIKHREEFRPFAPSCLLEKMNEYFDFDRPSPFMLFSVPVNQNKINEIPAVVHIDNSARLQTVNKNDNDLFYDLISDFYKITGMPILLNTSFNDREPVVETPADAIYTFLSTDIDFLAIGDYLVYKK